MQRQEMLAFLMQAGAPTLATATAPEISQAINYNLGVDVAGLAAKFEFFKQHRNIPCYH